MSADFKKVLVVSDDLMTRERMRINLGPFVNVFQSDSPENALGRIPQIGDLDVIVVLPGPLRGRISQFSDFVKAVLGLGFAGLLMVASDTPDNIKVLTAAGCNLSSRQDNAAKKLLTELKVL